MPTQKKTTVKQLKAMLTNAEEKVLMWTAYKEALVVALSSDPPGPPPPPPKS
jgi:hypothetical protein